MASTSTSNALNIVSLPPPPPIPNQPRHTYDSGAKSHHTPIVIDNGSSTLRFGWAGWADPICAQNAVSRFKERRQGKQLLLFGEAIDSESGARAQSKQPWEGDILVNPDALVSSLYIYVYIILTTKWRTGKRARLRIHLPSPGHAHSRPPNPPLRAPGLTPLLPHPNIRTPLRALQRPERRIRRRRPDVAIP